MKTPELTPLGHAADEIKNLLREQNPAFVERAGKLVSGISTMILGYDTLPLYIAGGVITTDGIFGPTLDKLKTYSLDPATVEQAAKITSGLTAMILSGDTYPFYVAGGTIIFEGVFGKNIKQLFADTAPGNPVDTDIDLIG